MQDLFRATLEKQSGCKEIIGTIGTVVVAVAPSSTSTCRLLLANHGRECSSEGGGQREKMACSADGYVICSHVPRAVNSDSESNTPRRPRFVSVRFQPG